MSIRALWAGFWVLLFAMLLALWAWFLLLRPVPQPSSNDPAWIFNHGSIGNETAQGIPYWIWRAMPTVFSDLLPGAGRGYSAFGMHWERGDELPIGFSKKSLGVIPRVAPNCAFCHQGTYRLRPEMPAQLVSSGAGTRVSPQDYIRFLMAAGQDARFNSTVLMAEIARLTDLPKWEAALYRYLLIPATKRALEGQAVRFAWMQGRPDWGPGRIDPFNPVKFANLGLGDDGTIGNSDMMPLWNLAKIEDGDPYWVHWDGLLTDIHETVVAGAIGDGMSHSEWPAAQDNIAAMEDFIRYQGPPRSPFSSDLPVGHRYHVSPVQVRDGREVYRAECAECHDPSGARFRTVIPLDEVGTDRHRLDMWTAEARDRYAAYEDGYAWGFEHFEKTDGYVANELTGLWLKGPYLHNGSVPTLAALLEAPGDRPTLFWRGSDLVDTRDGGFVSGEAADPYRRQTPYDTSLPGNGNAGHPWGTDLPRDRKRALLAYLKTL